MSRAGEQEQHLSETDVPVLLEQVMPGSVFKPDHPTALELSSESKKTLNSSRGDAVEHKSGL